MKQDGIFLNALQLDFEQGFEAVQEFFLKMGILQNLFEFDRIEGECDNHAVNLCFFLNGDFVFGINGVYMSDDTMPVQIGDGLDKKVEMNFHPFGAMGGFDEKRFEFEAKEANHLYHAITFTLPDEELLSMRGNPLHTAVEVVDGKYRTLCN